VKKLVAPRGAGSPRQGDLRRAVSSACYGLFHFCLAAAADEFVGATQRATSRYALVHRSIDNRTLKYLCAEATKLAPPAKCLPYFPVGGFSSNIRAFSSTAIELQEKRHLADYNPQPRFRTLDAKAAVNAARVAVHRFQAADQEHRKAFLTLLICPPR
jgi:hypothetical protein